MADIKFEGSHTILSKRLWPKEGPRLSESSYVIAGCAEPVTGPELLKAICLARFPASDAETFLGIPRNTLIRKAAELGTPFNSRGATRTRAGNTSSFNAYTTLEKPAAAKPAPASKPAARPVNEPAANGNIKPAEQEAPKPAVETAVPDTAKALKDVPDGGCEQYLGTKSGVPVYCAQTPAVELPRRDGSVFRCAAHRSTGVKAKLG